MADDFWGEPIHSYSRRQAIEDGVLVDISKMASEAGFKYPVAVTSAVWQGLVVPDEAGRQVGQSEEGRLWDLLWMLFLAIRKGQDGSELRYRVIFLMNGSEHREVELKAICGPGDDPAPVITVMLPNED